MPAEFSGRDDRVRDVCRRLAPIIGEQAQSIHAAWMAEDRDGREQIEHFLNALAAKHLSRDLASPTADLVPPEPTDAAGSYELGTVSYNERSIGPFGLREAEWIQHVGIFGRTGAV